MPTEHIVAPGDCIESIAVRYGFFPGTLWKAPENSTLRETRSEPHALAPGDTIIIPDLRPQALPVVTGKRHRFRRKGVPAVFRLQLLAGGDPRAGLAYTLTIEEEEFPGVTDGEGWIVQWISPAAMKGELRIDKDEVYEIRLGYMNPVDTPAGLRSRLVNLGYLPGSPKDAPGAEPSEEEIATAVDKFRADYGLPEGGEMDDATRRKLVEVHRS